MVLSELKKGENAKITAVGGEGATRQHFLDMGVIPGTEIEIVRFAPMGDPVELRLHGYELTMRLADAAEIEVEKLEEKGEPEHRTLVRFTKASSAHPGLGEG
ncbi:MAG: ferrous iron transport protein A, partial [Firmicutes bacterium]|nr:ferrous iron transport protein A [Bacillota bacterium]